jgi:polar amino acid transport system substrate-binding protein
VLDEACRWLRHEYKKTQCRLEKTLAPDLPPLTGNRPQMVQVLVNLLQNACQAATRPDMVVRVSASHDHEAGTVAIIVTDEGKGMAQEDIEHALDPFFTTRRSEGGMGLGLSISAAIVKAHGGSIHIESREGAGTAVTVMLPVAKGEEAHGG